MKPDDATRREELFASLLAQYDGELADDTQQDSIEEIEELDDELATDLRAAESCLDLLNRVRRQWTPPDCSQPGEPALSEKSFSGWQPPHELGQFKIERELGRGGLGIVYLAEDLQLGRKVALKIPRFDDIANADLEAQVLREAEAAARLSHPHVVTLHEVDDAGPICYLAAEYCPGPTLAQWLRDRTGPVPVRDAALLLLKLSEAVEHAHSRGVLHRDIKPSNVLLDTSAPGAERVCRDEPLIASPKLTDFGMAKLLEQGGGDTRTGEIIGTLAYMSPEQAEGRADKLDARTDVYALGALLYEMLVGSAPYRGKTDVETLRQLMTSEPVAPRQSRPDVPRDLEAICLQCLEREPARRYGTARELAADLRRYLAYEPTLARPLTSLQRATRWARRRPAVASLVAVILLAAGLLTAAGIDYTLRLQRHADELQKALTAKNDAQATALAHAEAARRTYPSDVRQAQQAWKDGRIAEATFLLEKHRPQPNEPDYRSFAWNFVWQLCHRDAPRFLKHPGPVYACTYSPDGQTLATAGEDGRVRLWDPASGKPIRDWQAHDKGIGAVSISSDGKWLATSAEDGSAVWQVATGQLLRRQKIGDDNALALTFLPDGRTLVAGGAAPHIELFDLADGASRARIPTDGKPVRMLTVSPDGKLLATTSDDLGIRLWDLVNLRPVATLEGHTRSITSIVFSHDGIMLASTSEDGRVKIWNVTRHTELRTFENRGGYIYHAAFTPDNRWLIAAQQDGRAQFWELDFGKPGRAMAPSNSRSFAVAISPDGRQAASADSDGRVSLWNGLPSPELVTMAEGNAAQAADVSPDSRYLALGLHSGSVRLYDMKTRELWKEFKAHSERQIDDIRFSNHGDMLATAGGDNAIRLWSFPSLRLLHTLHGHRGQFAKVRISPDGARVAACSEKGTVQIWQAADGALLLDLDAGSPTRDIAFSPDSRQIAAVTADGKVNVWNTADGAEFAAVVGHQSAATTLAWSPDGKLLATGGDDEIVVLWNTERFEPVSRILTRQGRITAVQFLPDGQSLASAGYSRTIKIWDVGSREELLTLDRATSVFYKVGFAEDGAVVYALAPSLKSCDFCLWSIQK